MREAHELTRADIRAAADRLDRRDIAWLLGILVLTTALRAFHLGAQSLWTDEVLTALSSSGSIGWVLTQTAINTNIPPLYYAIVHVFLAFGTDEAMLRLPSLLAGVASVVILYLVVRRWLGGRVALVSAAILAVSPFHIWYSQEARPYALLLFLSLLALWLLQELIAEPDDWRLRIAFVLAAASTFYCHTLGLPFIALLALYVGITVPRSEWTRWTLVFGAVGVLLVPGFYRLIVFAPNATADASRTFSPMFMPYTFWAFATGYSIGPTAAELHRADRLRIALRALPLVLPIAMVFVLIAGRGAWALWQRSRRLFSMVALWLLVPIGFAVAGTLLTRHPFNVRYVVLAFPAFVVLVAMGILAHSATGWRAFAVGAVGVVGVVSLGNYFLDPRYYREDNRSAGAFLAAHAAPGDLVVADAPYTARNLEYYARRADLTIAGYPMEHAASPQQAGAVFRSGAADLPSAVAGSDAELREIIGGRARFWLFLSRTYHGAPEGDVLQFCDRGFRRVQELRMRNDVRLILYQSRGDTTRRRLR